MGGSELDRARARLDKGQRAQKGDRKPSGEQQSLRDRIQPDWEQRYLGGIQPAPRAKPGTGMDVAKQMPERREQTRTQLGPLTLFLLLSQPCRLARIWLSMAWTQSSRSSDVEASKSHVWPVRETIMNSNGSSGSGKERCVMTRVREGGGLLALQGVSTETDPCEHRCDHTWEGSLAVVLPGCWIGKCR